MGERNGDVNRFNRFGVRVSGGEKHADAEAMGAPTADDARTRFLVADEGGVPIAENRANFVKHRDEERPPVLLLGLVGGEETVRRVGEAPEEFGLKRGASRESRVVAQLEKQP